MKPIIMSLLVIVGVGIAVYVFGVKKPGESYSKAETQEQAGNYPLAMSLYLSSLMGITDSRPMPSKAQGMESPTQTWVKELKNYIDWLSIASTPPQRLPAIVDAISRVGKHIQNQNYFTDLSVQKAPAQDYIKKWNSIFYPEGKTPPPGQQPVIEKAMDISISMVTLIGNTSYRYDGKAINCTTGKGVAFTVFNEGQFSLLAPPGNYYLIITSTATFPSGQVWISPADALTITVPDSTSLLSIKLNTAVKRRA
jgi:hypothetical protein